MKLQDIKIAAAAALSAVFGAASAQDHLEPEDSAFADGYAVRDPVLDNYPRHLVRVFHQFYKQPVSARAIVIPAFEPEFAIAILKADDGFISLRPEIQVYGFAYFEDYDRALRAGRIEPTVSMEATRRHMPTRLEDIP